MHIFPSSGAVTQASPYPLREETLGQSREEWQHAELLAIVKGYEQANRHKAGCRDAELYQRAVEIIAEIAGPAALDDEG